MGATWGSHGVRRKRTRCQSFLFCSTLSHFFLHSSHFFSPLPSLRLGVKGQRHPAEFSVFLILAHICREPRSRTQAGGCSCSCSSPLPACAQLLPTIGGFSTASDCDSVLSPSSAPYIPLDNLFQHGQGNVFHVAPVR